MVGGISRAVQEEDTGEVIVYSLEKLSLGAELSSCERSQTQQLESNPSRPPGLLSPAGADEEPSVGPPEDGDGSAPAEDEWETAAEHLVSPGIADQAEEEDEWERVEVPAVRPASSSRVKPVEVISAAGKRGRGAFRYGSDTDSLHSDGDEKLAFSGPANGVTDNRSSRAQEFVGESNEHVLEVYEFSPAIRTSEVEKLFAGYDQDGLTIKWVDDTHALAIFRSTAAAQRALRGVKDARFRIRQFVEASPAARMYSHAELLPAPPRPATTATVAHRLIMGTLRKQGVSLPPSQYTNQLRAEERQLAGERLRRQANRNSARASAWDD